MSDLAKLDKIGVLREWLAGRPEVIRKLVREWPPLCEVTSREETPLTIPAPGKTGVVQSYFENGTLGVVAEMAETLTSPITGITATAGEPISGQCRPENLVLLGYGEFTPEDVEEALR